MGLTGILTLIVVGGIAGGAYYYRDGITSAFASEKEKEINLDEKQYDFDRKQKHDAWWDNYWKTAQGRQKTETKQKQKGSFDPNNDPSKFNPPNSNYNAKNPYGYVI